MSVFVETLNEDIVEVNKNSVEGNLVSGTVVDDENYTFGFHNSNYDPGDEIQFDIRTSKEVYEWMHPFFIILGQGDKCKVSLNGDQLDIQLNPENSSWFEDLFMSKTNCVIIEKFEGKNCNMYTVSDCENICEYKQ